MQVRDAAAGDAAAIAAIYNAAVRGTTAIWNETPVDAADRAAWIADRQGAGFAVVVAAEPGRGPGGGVVGYAAFGPFRAFDGYRHTVEHSVYVRADRQGAGIGAALMAALIARARAQGRHAMVGAVEAGNAASIRLHERLGFAAVGRMPQVGAKFGRWLDLALLQLTLDDRPEPPGGGGA